MHRIFFQTPKGAYLGKSAPFLRRAGFPKEKEVQISLKLHLKAGTAKRQGDKSGKTAPSCHRVDEVQRRNWVLVVLC
jgi:hypothetical protein